MPCALAERKAIIPSIMTANNNKCVAVLYFLFVINEFYQGESGFAMCLISTQLLAILVITCFGSHFAAASLAFFSSSLASLDSL